MRLLIALALFGGLATAEWEAAHERFRSSYRPNAGAEARQKALREVAKADVPEAAELLVNVWGFLDRDAVRRRKDLYATRSKMRALRGKLKSASARQRSSLIAQLEKLQAREDTSNTRLSAIELEQVAILDGLQGMKDSKVIDWFATNGVRFAKSPAVLRVLAAKVAQSPGAGAGRLLTALDKVRKPDQIIPLLQALGERSAHAGAADWKAGLPAILRHLGHREWAVRVAAGYALARAAQPEGCGPLVAAIGKEAAGSRARQELGRSLTLLTGQRFGSDAELWARWWAANQAKVFGGEVELGKGKLTSTAKNDQGRFYGIPQVATRIVYVLDISGSMEVSMEDPRWIDGGPVAARDDEDSRFDAASRELIRATRRLRRGTQFAVVFYHSHVVPVHAALIPATKDNLTKLEQTIARVGPSGSTNIYEALDHSLRLANVHPDSKGPNKADAIYLISDGSPTSSKGKSEPPERTLIAVKTWNAHQRVAIHTIGIGAQHNASFLQALAAQNGGEYYAVLPKKKK